MVTFESGSPRIGSGTRRFPLNKLKLELASGSCRELHLHHDQKLRPGALVLLSPRQSNLAIYENKVVRLIPPHFGDRLDAMVESASAAFLDLLENV